MRQRDEQSTPHVGALKPGTWPYLTVRDLIFLHTWPNLSSDSLAARAGLVLGDKIVRVNNKRVLNSVQALLHAEYSASWMRPTAVKYMRTARVAV